MYVHTYMYVFLQVLMYERQDDEARIQSWIERELQRQRFNNLKHYD
jgi:hypothetical protein